VRHVAEVLVEVERVADHELVRDLEGHVVGRVSIALHRMEKLRNQIFFFSECNFTKC
jgi:hypothetical protein